MINTGIKCAQYLVKNKFSNVCGLCSTLQQQKQVAPLEPNSLQIIHIYQGTGLLPQ